MITAEKLRAWEKEVVQVNRQKGWFDQPVPFAQALALLHEEAAEAGHAWRDHGLADATSYTEHVPHGGGTSEGCPGCFAEPKPEGVGSELADVLIRWLDYEARFKMDSLEYLEADPHVFALDENFLVNINTLHGLIAGVTHAHDTSYESPQQAFASVLQFTEELAAHCGIDLEAEYERKLAYNRTRPYRHGNRRA